MREQFTLPCAFCGAPFYPWRGKPQKSCSLSCRTSLRERAKRFTSPEQMKEHLHKNVKITAAGCWEWQRGRDSKGYGMCLLWKGMRQTHRIAYELFKGPIGNLGVLHTCDNPPCCNPDHLWLGTQKDNALDCVAKGRNRPQRGEASHRSKLTAEIVRKIYFSPTPAPEIAAAYGVSNDTVTLIRRGQVWKHLQLSGRVQEPHRSFSTISGVMQRRCGLCRVYQPLSNFSNGGRGQPHCYCRPCAAKKQMQRKQRLRERGIAP